MNGESLDGSHTKDNEIDNVLWESLSPRFSQRTFVNYYSYTDVQISGSFSLQIINFIVRFSSFLYFCTHIFILRFGVILFVSFSFSRFKALIFKSLILRLTPYTWWDSYKSTIILRQSKKYLLSIMPLLKPPDYSS